MVDIDHMKNSTHFKRHAPKRKFFLSKLITEVALLIIGLGLLLAAVMVVWIATIKLPDFTNFENRKIVNSTKIYDKTGKILLYDFHDNIRRTQIPSDKISPYIKNAAVAIEDSHFYEHYGIRPLSILRAIYVNIVTGSYSQGGSTITQQVVKNALLTREKTISRKITEWMMAIKLDAQVDKDDILTIYLNESPYGGSIYGVEEASLSYFGKSAKDVTLAEAAYLAAMPQSPTYYSPFGNHIDALKTRQQLVLRRMFDLNLINDGEYQSALAEDVKFKTRDDNSGKALHFVFYVREYLENKYGKDALETGGLQVITTLDYNLQKKAEEIVKRGALENERKFKAKNAGLIAIDPKTGQILAMVGSRDYFDKEIDGAFNITTALRQPGSTMKPIVYALAFQSGLEPETVLFDLPTQFSTRCDAVGNPLNGGDSKQCYMPENFDGAWHGPISLRSALQLSLNIPAVKLQYIVGVQSTLNLAKKLGINSLGSASQYGLSLVLGGGEVSLLDLTNVYATFANNGINNPTTPILSVTDVDGTLLEKFKLNQTEALPKAITDELTDVLTDNNARVPEFGVYNKLYFGERPVAAKTGTTNDYKDVWTVGYTPSIAVGMWGGNNDNTPIDKKIAGMVIAPVWNEFMHAALDGTPIEYFDPYTPNSEAPSFIKGIYCDASSPAHTILYDLGKGTESQAALWQYPISQWAATNGCPYGGAEATSTAILQPSEMTTPTQDPNTVVLPQTILPPAY